MVARRATPLPTSLKIASPRTASFTITITTMRLGLAKQTTMTRPQFHSTKCRPPWPLSLPRPSRLQPPIGPIAAAPHPKNCVRTTTTTTSSMNTIAATMAMARAVPVRTRKAIRTRQTRMKTFALAVVTVWPPNHGRRRRRRRDRPCRGRARGPGRARRHHPIPTRHAG